MENERTYNILVYGIDKKGLLTPTESINARNYTLSFENFGTPKRFNDFDGVILFKGTFETFKREVGYEIHLEHTCDRNDLDKRKNEAELLTKKGGFLCFLLDEPFFDKEGERSFLGTDLAKVYLNYRHLNRKNFRQRVAPVRAKADEFRPFLELFGAASTYFENHHHNLDFRVLAECSGRTCGMILHRDSYFIPSLLPDNREEALAEYFRLLSEALVSSYNKLQVKLPDWVKSFPFDEEASIRREEDELRLRLQKLKERTNHLNNFKSVLALTGNDLVTNVLRLFSEGFGIAVDERDDLREDFKLLDRSGQAFCLCEVKGVNKGVKREHINQADSHRERSGFDQNFPSLLIVNTHIKNARSVAEKDQEIAGEQIRHAVNMNVLIVRTLDLIVLLRMFLENSLKREELEHLLCRNKGWLRADDHRYEVNGGA